MLARFLDIGLIDRDKTNERNGKIYLINSMLTVTAVAIAILTIVQWSQGAQVIINLLYILSATASIYLILKYPDKFLLFSYFMIAVSTFVLTYWLWGTPEVYLRILWFMILIAFAFLVDGLRGGILVSIVSIIIIILFFTYANHTANLHIMVLTVTFIVLIAILIGIYEQREEIAKKRLLEMNLLLEERVKEETEKLSEKTEAYKKLALYDPLTGLPNRTLFYERLKQAIAKAKRNRTKLAVLFIDLDNFKSINDLYGHQLGDEILSVVAHALQLQLRESDTLSRFGGDEFIVIVEELRSITDAAIVAQNLRKGVSNSFMHKGHEIFTTFSIGISGFPDDSEDIDELIKQADTAMYHAKSEGKNLIQFYATSMTQELQERMMMEGNIRRGIDNGEFKVYYQTIIDGNNGTLIGLEALVRWNHPEKGLIGPDLFIPVAEGSSLITLIGETVLSQVVSDVNQWIREGFDPGYVAVNVSTRQLSDPKFLSVIQDAKKSVSANHQWLELEITESYMMNNPEQSIQLLKTIQAMNVGISLDDFGTGYSSLSYLKRLPVHTLKIDRMFIRDIPGNPEDEALVRTIIAIGKSLGLKVVAEGVEKDTQKDYLIRQGCTRMQGYFFSKPMPKEEIVHFVSENLKKRA